MENLQLFFVRLALRLPHDGAPRITLRSETGLLAMKYRIWKAKCMFCIRTENRIVWSHQGGIKMGNLGNKSNLNMIYYIVKVTN